MVPAPGIRAGVTKAKVPGTVAAPPVRGALARDWP